MKREFGACYPGWSGPGGPGGATAAASLPERWGDMIYVLARGVPSEMEAACRMECYRFVGAVDAAVRYGLINR